jgi:putative phosphoribosyl transferase
MVLFHDRSHAGRLLAQILAVYSGDPEVIVLGLPRGGVPVAFEVAQYLHAPLDVLIVRKLGVPGQEEFAFGAISSGGGQILNVGVVDMLQLSRSCIEEVANRERKELERRERLYRGQKPPLVLGGRRGIVVDDGLATGSTMLAAVTALRHLEPSLIVVAIPVAPLETQVELQRVVDELFCLQTPKQFHAVGEWYEDFSQTSDEEVCRLLQEASSFESKD